MILKKPLNFSEYNKNSPRLFKKEKLNLQKIGAREVHHVGSSAIPNMPGKGAIDILILSRTQEEKLKLKSKLILNGYTQGKSKERFRYFFWKIKDNQEYCIHLILSSNPISKDQILFRDYIIQNPKEFEKYSKLKEINFKKSKGNRAKYRELKQKYFQKILNKICKN